jgi:hypothetical protein
MVPLAVPGRLGRRPVKLTAENKAAALAVRDRGDLTMSQSPVVGVGRTILCDHLDLPPGRDRSCEDGDDEQRAIIRSLR